MNRKYERCIITRVAVASLELYGKRGDAIILPVAGDIQIYVKDGFVVVDIPRGDHN